LFSAFAEWFRKFWCVLKRVWIDIGDNHTMSFAAGLSYYFVLSLFPLLIFLAAVVGYLPIPHLFGRIVGAMSQIVPPDSMGLVRAVLRDVVSRGHGGLLTFGVLGTVWSATAGFSSLIEALNVSYDIPETRPIWSTRLVSFGLMLVVGTLMVVGATLMFVGPEFGYWLADKVGLSHVFGDLWPYIRWTVSVLFLVLAVEAIFYWAPNVKQKFKATLPGAIMGVAFWLATSFALGFYFRNFANFNRTYGTLGGAIALMVWLYYSWFVILVAAEINSELLKASGGGRLPLKAPPPHAVRRRPAWEEEIKSEAEKAEDEAA